MLRLDFAFLNSDYLVGSSSKSLPPRSFFAMSASVRDSIYEAIAAIRLIDPHTHINPHSPASSTLADLLGYHYYTELAHSAGMPKAQIEEPGIEPRELVGRLVSNLSPIENTAQYRWLVEICRMFFGFDGDRIDESNWEEVYDAAERQMRLAEWPQIVLDQSNVEAVFLTNDFDDDLAGFDSDTYIPCLRTDDLVFHLAKPEVRERLARCSGIELDGSLTSLRESLNQRFSHFVARGARACAISLPPTFEPLPVGDGRAETALNEVLRKGPTADASHINALSRRVFWTLAELCDEYGLPFDLMIGVNRGVYADGVFQGQDLYDSRVSLIQYKELFNSFPAVKFPVSVLASVTNQELVSYAWIFPNVITNGHWWYSNTPSFIARDAAARLEAVPQTKQIAYYSDAYKLEFVWPKFDMYRRVLAGILADQFVGNQGWSEERAVELARQVLRDNVDEIFPRPAGMQTEGDSSKTVVDTLADTWEEDGNASESSWSEPILAGGAAVAVATRIGAANPMDEEESPAEVVDEQQGDTYATLMEPLESESAPVATSEPEALEDTGNETPTTEPAGLDETINISEEPEAHDTDLDELPTMVDLQDTVKIEEEPVVPALDVELDPPPNADEIQAIDVPDVQLDDFGAERIAPTAESLESLVEDAPLDVGDLTAEAEDAISETVSDEIQMLRGEESFSPDEDSLRLQPDPATGELTFPVPEADTPAAQETVEVEQEVVDSGVYETTEDMNEPADPGIHASWTADELLLDLDEDAIDNGTDNVVQDVDDTIEINPTEAPEDENLLGDSNQEL